MYLLLKVMDRKATWSHVGVLPANRHILDVLTDRISVAVDAKKRQPRVDAVMFVTMDLEPQLWSINDENAAKVAHALGRRYMHPAEVCDIHPFNCSMREYGDTLFKEDRLVVFPDAETCTSIHWEAKVEGAVVSTPTIFVDQLEDVAEAILGPSQKAVGRLGRRFFDI